MSEKEHTTAESVHWGYTGDCGPEYWGKLCPEFQLSSTGKNQSPINLTGIVKADLAPLQFDYQAGGVEICNNGHSVQVNVAPGSTLNAAGYVYELKQYHFHVPSENHINGQPFPMESHLVHMDSDGNIAVVAVMYVTGPANPALSQAWAHMPETVGCTYTLNPAVPVTDLLPENRAYYRFNGSLTTPPCTEGVCWFVMKAPVTVSQAQIDYFARVMGVPNNRPLQPLNARVVLG
ncbi:MAG: carbonic anhydrase [Anaerolineae bacterium]|nr:carbonic anhydrase [Anaerolineae bacterium]